MPAVTMPLSVSRVDVTPSDGSPRFQKASVLVRGTTAKVVTGGAAPVVVEDVVSVERETRSAWKITFASGLSWTVTRAKGCGCGGGR